LLGEEASSILAPMLKNTADLDRGREALRAWRMAETPSNYEDLATEVQKEATMFRHFEAGRIISLNFSVAVNVQARTGVPLRELISAKDWRAYRKAVRLECQPTPGAYK
jgi:hypothetical protein